MHPVDERLFAKLPQKLSKGEATITFIYTGTVNEQNKGFYKAKYSITDSDGKAVDKVMMTTQCEAPDARTILPCWDEPLVKATFDVTLVVDKHLTVLSNEAEKSSVEEGEKKCVTFARSPKMSTYLLAFCVAELEYVEETVKKLGSGEPTVIRVYTTIGKKHKTDLAMEYAKKSLALYEEFFQVDYMLPKLDLVGVPDFAAGAMENWGLVTFRETVLLCDETSSFRTRLFVALVVAHELAHMWFGNYVTMKWWKELWLNESFATFMEFQAVHEINPEWQPWATFVAEDYGTALRLDSMKSSHAVEVNVRLAREIGEIFDAISYAKGCSLMRMCVAWIGYDKFRAGMRTYVREFAYSNATTVDLWKHLSESSKMPVADVMETWTSKQGYPVLHVSRNGGTLTVKQNRFLSSGTPDEETLWQIPIVIGTDKGTEAMLIKGAESEVSIPADAEWVKVNYDQTAVARVAYSDDMLEALSKAVAEGKLSNVNTTGLISDVAALSTAGVVSATQVLKIAKSSASQGKDLTVMTALATALGDVKHILRDSKEASQLMDKFNVALLAPLGEELGWENREGDDGRVMTLRGMVQSRLAGSGHEASLAEARKRFDAYMATKDEKVLPSDMRGGVYSAVVKADTTAATWEQLAKIHEAHDTDPSEVSRCCVALSASQDTAIIQRTLEYCWDKDKTRSQNVAIFMRSLGTNAAATDLHYEFLTSHFKEGVQRFPEMSWTSIVGSLKQAVQESQAVRMEKWWETVDESDKTSSATVMKQNFETIRIASIYRERDFDNVVAYLKAQ